MKDLTQAWLEAAFLDMESARRLLDDDFFTRSWATSVDSTLEYLPDSRKYGLWNCSINGCSP